MAVGVLTLVPLLSYALTTTMPLDPAVATVAEMETEPMPVLLLAGVPRAVIAMAYPLAMTNSNSGMPVAVESGETAIISALSA